MLNKIWRSILITKSGRFSPYIKRTLVQWVNPQYHNGRTGLRTIGNWGNGKSWHQMSANKYLMIARLVISTRRRLSTMGNKQPTQKMTRISIFNSFSQRYMPTRNVLYLSHMAMNLTTIQWNPPNQSRVGSLWNKIPEMNDSQGWETQNC